MQRHGRLLLLAALAFSANSYADLPCTLSASKVQQRLEREGGEKTLQELYGNYSNTWFAVLACIATGKQAWVDIAVSLRSYSETETLDGLEDAMGEALGNNPTYVLDKAVPTFDLLSICFGPDPDSSLFVTYNSATKEWDRRVKALAGVKRVDLRDKVQKCQTYLNDDEPQEANFQG